jgi:hypothetical protein
MATLPPSLRNQLDDFLAGPSRVRAAVDGVDAGLLNRRPPGEDWSIRDIVIHLADAELVGAVRFRLVLAQDDPVLPTYDQEAWKRRLQYLWRDPEVALALFQSTRWSTAEILDNCGADAWRRTGIHPERGPMTVTDLLALYIDHTNDHAAQIHAARSALS